MLVIANLAEISILHVSGILLSFELMSHIFELLCRQKVFALL